MTPHHTHDMPWPRLADCATVNSQGLIEVLGRVVAVALSDWRTGYRHQGTPDAAAFLSALGMLTDEGLIDRHGYRLKGPQGRPRKLAGMTPEKSQR